ncbi:MAG: hypothetical protein C4339_06225 [Nitrososphaerota archaeon]
MVSLKPLREAILECGPDLVKMDSQRGEYALLLTESEMIRKCALFTREQALLHTRSPQYSHSRYCKANLS